MTRFPGLDAYHALLDLSERELLDRIGVSEDDVRRDTRYEQLEGLDVVQPPGATKAWIYLKHARVELV